MEVTAQIPFRAGKGEGVAGLGEVVDTDGVVAMPGQYLMTQPRHAKALLLSRERGGVIHALPRDEVRHVGVAEQRNAVRLQSDRSRQAVVEVVLRLSR